MDEILLYINQHALYAHWIIFGALLLAGFNIPVSEDAMLFISAYLAVEHPDNAVKLFAGVFAGAYLSDLICYGLGRFLGVRLWNIKWFAKMVSRRKVEQISAFYERYGVVTLIFGRFIPFGVRNGLFLTAGLGSMNFRRFALADLVAATISCSVYFGLYYTYGHSVIEWVKRSNAVLFGVAVCVVGFLLVRSRYRKKRAVREGAADEARDEASA